MAGNGADAEELCDELGDWLMMTGAKHALAISYGELTQAQREEVIVAVARNYHH